MQRRAWLIVLPLLLDVWLWLGPRLSIQSLVDKLLAFWSPSNFPPEFLEMAQPYQALLADLGQRFNLLWLLSSGLTWLNELTPRLNEPGQFGAADPPLALSPLALLLWAPLLTTLGVGLGSLFLASLVSQLQPAGESSFPWLRRSLRTWGLLLLYGLLLLAALLVATLILSLALTAIMLVAPGIGLGLGSLGLLLFGWVAIWVYLMLYFVAPAIVWDGVSLPQALWRSANVVARNFWSTIGLVVLTNLILSGFGFIWQRFSVSAWGALAGMVGNAFLLTGLALARLIFYRDRFVRWQEMLAAQKASKAPLANS